MEDAPLHSLPRDWSVHLVDSKVDSSCSRLPIFCGIHDSIKAVPEIHFYTQGARRSKFSICHGNKELI